MDAEPQSDGNSAAPAATTAQPPATQPDATRPPAAQSTDAPAATQPAATIAVTWSGEQTFDAARPDRPAIRLDGSGSTGPSPVDGLLASLASCAGIDVVEILAKRRTPANSIRIDVVGERVATIPKRLKHVTLNFHIVGAGIDRANAERAIDLAVNKYCSVRDSIRQDVPVEWTLELGE